jgi:type IV secretory pathway VirB9-like protein
VKPRGRAPAWMPERVFDDGHKTYIQFAPDLGTTEAPPLFVIGENKQAELVNYRVQGRYYVVDRLITAAELRLGTKEQQIVRIERKRDRRS